MSTQVKRIIVLTDAHVIARLAEQESCVALMSDSNLTFSERILTGCQACDENETVMVVSGDEVELKPQNLDICCSTCLRNPSRIYHAVGECKDPNDASKFKIVCNRNRQIMYISRNPIPHVKYGSWRFLQLVGIVGGPVTLLKKVLSAPQTDLSIAEDAGPLPWLEEEPLYAVELPNVQLSLDVDSDLKRIRESIDRDPIYKNIIGVSNIDIE